MLTCVVACLLNIGFAFGYDVNFDSRVLSRLFLASNTATPQWLPRVSRLQAKPIALEAASGFGSRCDKAIFKDELDSTSTDLRALTRSQAVRLLLSAIVCAAPGQPAFAESVAPVAAPVSTKPEITDRAYIDLRIVTNMSAPILEDVSIRGRLAIGLYGKNAPEATARFLKLIDGTMGQFAATAEGPKFTDGRIKKLRPGLYIESGDIPQLTETTFAGEKVWSFDSSPILEMKPILEDSGLKHDRRGLLTREMLYSGPKFAITLGEAKSLDETNEVFGIVEDGFDLIDRIETLPYLRGSDSNPIIDWSLKFTKQVKGLAKTLGDERATGGNEEGNILTRIEITGCGRVLPKTITAEANTTAN
mmetsp:Transcript_3451/g.5747  ORF Transcript_3451/g.5747 Transcript_3451/m.5747 type:complete len:362 (+) Transcript_3451:28-1113(+)